MEIKNKVKEYKTISSDDFLKLTPNTLKKEGRDIKKLKNAIRKDGFSFPNILWQDFIIDGSGRQLAVREMINEGDVFEEIPVVYVEAKDIKEAKAKALQVSSQFGDITKDSFLAFTNDLELDFDTFEIKGIDKDMFIEPDEKDDIIPENVPSRSKLGDLYELGQHRVLCGDSTQQEAVLRLMEGKKADMVFTDPPYSVNYAKKNKEILGAKEYTEIKNDDMKVEDIARELWKPVFDNLAEVSKDGASIYVTMPQGGDQMMMMMMMDSWQVKHELIWVKNSPVFSMGRLDYDYMHEPILYGWKKNHQFYGGGQYKKSVWNIQRDGNKSHPTMKPVELITNMLSNSSKQEDIMIDFFLGSGSSVIASEKTGRICYGMELDPKYVDVIVQRYVDYTGNENIKLNGQDIIWKKTEKKQ